jgi:hypothetical protein
MTRDFDELVGDVEGEERERLRRVHDLLVEAGPMPELTHKLERPTAPPTADIAYFPKRRHAAAAVAAAAIAAAAFGGGYLVGHSGGGDEFAAQAAVSLHATGTAPETARASIQLGERDGAGNFEMVVTVGGLPKLEQERSYYRLWLKKGERATLPCGDFVVEGPDKRTTVRFTVSYSVKPGDRWIVAYQPPGKHDEPGPVLLST